MIFRKKLEIKKSFRFIFFSFFSYFLYADNSQWTHVNKKKITYFY